MIRHLLIALALAAGVSGAAQAQTVDVVQVCGASSGVVTALGPGGHLTRDVNGNLCVTGGSGGGGSSGSITAAGTNGTTAQAVQGINGGVPVAIQGGNANAVKTDGSAVTQPVSSTTLATAANQARSAPYADASFASVPASGAFYGTVHASLTSASKFNIWAGCAATGATIYLQGSNDGFTASAVTISSAGIPAGSAAASGETLVPGTQLTVPVFFSSYRARIVNGTTATNCSVVSSFTAN
jgi:hypothetical protein